MQSEPVIFLDVDGVLNQLDQNGIYYAKCYKGIRYPIDPHCVDLILKLVEKTNAEIVIHSSWRNDEEAVKVLRDYIPEFTIVDQTFLKRLQSILEHVKNHDIKNYLIIDDEPLAASSSHFIQTHHMDGFTKENLKTAITLLTKVESNLFDY